MTQPTYALTGFRETFAGIETLVVLNGQPVTIVTGVEPYGLAPARSWREHGEFLTWAEGEYGSVEQAVGVLIERHRRT